MNIKILVVNKVAAAPDDAVIVCGNSDYTISFVFDNEWANEASKIARFTYRKNGAIYYKDVSFDGDTVSVPVLAGIRMVSVGVYAGELRTTTPARITCAPSILCVSATHDESDATAWPSLEQRVALLEESGGGVDVSDAQVGQTIVVEEVDENGKPTKWKATDFPKNEGTVKSVNNVEPDENGNVEIEVGGEQVQSDWNQNDPEQPDYVKNRPFYSHTEDEADYLVEPMDLQFVYGEAYPDNPIVVSPDDFAKGNVLYVVWDGTVYECTVKYHNMAMFNYIGGEDEPFTISDDNGTGELRIENAQSTFTGTVSFALAKSLAKTTLVRMDEKYLPESVKAGLENVNTRVDETNSRIDATNTELEAAMQSIPHSEIVPDRIYEDVGEGYNGLCSDITPDVSAIIGAKAFLNSQESGLIEHYVTAADITQYDWGYDFKYGSVVTMEDADGAPGSVSGLYMWAEYDYLDDRYTPKYASYGLEINYRLSADLLPLAAPTVPVAEVGQTIVVESLNENKRPASWKTFTMPDMQYQEIINATYSPDDVAANGYINIAEDSSGKRLNLRNCYKILLVCQVTGFTPNGTRSPYIGLYFSEKSIGSNPDMIVDCSCKLLESLEAPFYADVCAEVDIIPGTTDWAFSKTEMFHDDQFLGINRSWAVGRNLSDCRYTNIRITPNGTFDSMDVKVYVKNSGGTTE